MNILLSKETKHDYSIITVHDCFGTHPNNMENLFNIVRDEFIKIYLNKDFIDKFHDRNLQNIKDYGYIFLNFLPSDLYAWVYSNLAYELAEAYDNYLSNASLENANLLLNNFLQIEILGQSLYTYGAMWLLISSIILLLSMISSLYFSNIKIYKKKKIKFF